MVSLSSDNILTAPVYFQPYIRYVILTKRKILHFFDNSNLVLRLSDRPCPTKWLTRHQMQQIRGFLHQ